MSQKPSASRPASRSPTDGRNITLPPVQLRDDSQQMGRPAEGLVMSPEFEGQGTMRLAQPAESPQFGHGAQGMASGDDQRMLGASRGLGVHTILNPAESELSASSAPRLGSGVAQSPQFASQTPQYPSNPPTFAPQGFGGQQTAISSSPTAGRGRNPSRGGRKTLVPRSPRAVSLGGRPAPTFSAQQAPFITSDRGRAYTAVPGTGPSSAIPPMPMAAGPAQQSYNVAQTGPPQSLGRRPSMATLAAATRRPISQSTSPSPSARSPYSGPSQTSPSTALPALGLPPQGVPQGAPYHMGPTFAAQQQGDGSSQAGPPGTEGPYTSSLPETIFRGAQSGGQNPNIRFMPIATEHGPMFVPVDVQQASRVADEKRARNAGASARFRERRKQKEKEANQTIQKLEQQVRDVERKAREAEHDRDFYRSERDRFRDVCYRNPSTRDLVLQSPISPRLNRAAAFPPPPPPAGPMFQTQETGSQDVERPARRRRTEEYVFNVAPAPGLTPYQGPTTYGSGPTQGGMQPPTNLPPLRMSSVATSIEGGSGPSTTPLSTTRPPSFEQHPRSGYDRGWPGDGGGGQRQ